MNCYFPAVHHVGGWKKLALECVTYQDDDVKRHGGEGDGEDIAWCDLWTGVLWGGNDLLEVGCVPTRHVCKVEELQRVLGC